MRVVQEPDAVSGRSITIIALCVVVVTAIGVLIAWQLREAARRPIGAEADFHAKRWGEPPAEVNAIELSQFPNAGREDRWEPSPGVQELAVQDPQQYGWSDRARDKVRIPLSRAKELYLLRLEAASRDAGRAGGAGQR